MAAQGEVGITRVLGTIRREIEIAMALSGVTTLAQIGRDALVDPPNV